MPTFPVISATRSSKETGSCRSPNDHNLMSRKTKTEMPPMDSCSSPSFRWYYDVFLSFRGEDTRTSFTAHLCDALRQRGINTFIDDSKLRKGQVISPALFRAIQNSMFAIVVLSKNYASSSWCLEELVKILESKANTPERVLPIFYNVDPSNVRKQKGEFGQSFKKLIQNLKGEKMKRLKIWRLVKILKDRKKNRVKILGLHKNFKGWKKDRVKIWRKALAQVANIAGWDSRNRHEPRLIKEIIAAVSNQLFSRYSSDKENLAGINPRIEEIMPLLRIASSDVRIIGICGMGGIGKTTLANAVYGRICHQFESSVFLENVGEDFKQRNLINLKQKLLSLLADDGNLNIRGCTSTQGKLCTKKVLIVLDNVKDGAILEYLTMNRDSFGPWSRIIVTTREKHLLASYKVEHYEVRGLNENEAMQVLVEYSSKHELAEDDLEELSGRIISYAQGLPLALKILGPLLFGKKKHEWRSHLNKLESTPHPEIQQVLRISYDELDNKEKNIFLDIACFFKNEDKDRVMGIFEGCGFFPQCGIGTLLDKSLITISDNKLRMHDLIQAMAMEVVRQYSPSEPGKWSRLWWHEDVSQVLKRQMGTGEVEGIFLDLSQFEQINFTSEAFVKMNKLRLLIVYMPKYYEKECRVKFSRNFTFPSGDLRYLHWHGYSLRSLPVEFNPENLVELSMPHSHMNQLWEGKKDLEKLKFLNLRHSQFLKRIPDLSRATNLEGLSLKDCCSLRAVDPSLANLRGLVYLVLRNCINLREFPSSLELESLEILILSGCSKLRKFPEIKGHMKHLKELLLDGTDIEELPSSIDQYAPGLVVLDLTNCKRLKSLPNGICNLESLETLMLSDCSKLDSLPQDFGKLKGLRKLHVDRTALRRWPDSFIHLRFTIKELSFSGCKTLPTTLISFSFLVDLNLSDCNIVDGMQLHSLSHLSALRNLDLSGNNFVWLPSSFSQLSRLLMLNLRNCRGLQELPELPSNIEIIRATDCISLRKITNLPLEAEGIWLTNCLESVDDPNIIKSIIQISAAKAKLQFLLYTQRGGIRHLFSVLIPAGSRIPEWFNHQNEGSSVSITPSPNLSPRNLLGFAFCAVLHPKDDKVVTSPDFPCYCSITFYNLDRKPDRRSTGIFIEDGLMKSDHIWTGYVLSPPKEEWHTIEISFTISSPLKETAVTRCGVRLIYIEDMSENNVTMIDCTSASQPASVILQELDENSAVEEIEVKRSTLDAGEPSGSGLQSKNGEEHFVSEAPTDLYSAIDEEGDTDGRAACQDQEELVPEDIMTRRSLNRSGNEFADDGSCACDESKAKERKDSERSHLRWDATFSLGLIFCLVVGSFWMKGRPSQKKIEQKRMVKKSK